MIGFLFIFVKNDRNNIISSSLGFASGVMITISIIDLIPNSFLLISKNNKSINTLFCVLIGLFLGILISSIIDIKVEKHSKNKLKLYKLGIINMLAIILHNIPEGIVTYITSTNNINLGISITIAIALHNIPEGISISIPIYYATRSKLKPFIYTLISAISEPLGAIFAYLFLSKAINNTVLGIIYSIVGGIMINIAINELYRESISYNKKNTIIYFILGSLIMIVNHIMLN